MHAHNETEVDEYINQASTFITSTDCMHYYNHIISLYDTCLKLGDI